MAFPPQSTEQQHQRLTQMIHILMEENPRQFTHLRVPEDLPALQRTWRSLVNMRPPMPVSDAYLQLEDAFLRDNLADQPVTTLQDIPENEPGIHLWQGDITLLQSDGIVNAANSGMTGCYAPCHGCIDNVIHTFSGVRLRLACHQQMEAQGYLEPAGQAKITPGYNLPANYVLHTVGPIINGPLWDADERLLASCYQQCLLLASAHGLTSLAFPCISTGEFHFPKKRAAEIAVDVVRQWMLTNGTGIQVIFNVYLDEDRRIYAHILG